jgi:signal transduction histidine kinase
MLYEFLIENREKILAMAGSKTSDISDGRRTTAESERGLPQFYDILIDRLEKESKGMPKGSEEEEGPDTTVRHGKELSRLGYTVSQVVKGYGTLCQAITELAQQMHAPITPGEFSTLNLSLDLAISGAVTGFAERVERVGTNESAKRIGGLVHELRNCLAAVTVAHTMVKQGIVGSGGTTNALMERNLARMRDILDMSFSQVRMQQEKAASLQPVLLLSIAEEVEATAGEDARLKGVTLKVMVDPDLEVDADDHYLISALGNLVHNAIKYSKKGGTVWVRGKGLDENVVLEVEDQCGGLPEGKTDDLFRGVAAKGSDWTRSGLTISRQAITLNKGTLTARDLPGQGCIFTISLPKRAPALV